eukprot:90765-Rhodomonas_salina.1
MHFRSTANSLKTFVTEANFPIQILTKNVTLWQVVLLNKVQNFQRPNANFAAQTQIRRAMLAEDLACAACGVKNSIMKRCTRCRIVYYCGRDCQVAHWGQHKVQCTSVEPNAGEQQNRGGADENASSQNPLDNNPMYSGIRVSPDGG